MSYEQRPLIDADSIVYGACFACKEDEPVANALHTIKLTMERIIDEFSRGLEYKTFLTGSNNYRFQIATLNPYKGNRKQEKPIWYKEAREYLQYAWAAKIIDGMEADDAISIEQWANKDRSTCIVTIDKDLKNTPGWHYNWRTKEHFYVDNTEAWRNFYRQMIVGDRTDNILTLKGLGDKAADKALNHVQDVNQMRKIVEGLYKEHGPKTWPGKDWRECMRECGQLLWMQREEGVLWE